MDHSKTLREQGIEETEILLLKRKYFYSDANVDARWVHIYFIQRRTQEFIQDKGLHI